ncbi:MAG: SDR family oxidoreductase [Proteobacteria bacterium]|nr:SDR family oxidoreductase [Pseudomonadota bacterium]
MGGLLKDKVAAITGGGGDIGAAIARSFAANGCKVVVFGRSREPLDRVAFEVSGVAVAGDVAVEADVARLMETCEDRFGRLDVLVNNAGITGPVASVEDMDMVAFDRTVATNLRGVILCMKHAIPLLKRQGGSIINVSSILGLRGQPRRTPYTATKFAVIAITQSAAHELGGSGVRVNALCPGAVRTGLNMRLIAERSRVEGVSKEELIRTGYVDVSALKKWVEPEDVAAAALFLASDAAGAITGTHLKVDCGRLGS